MASIPEMDSFRRLSPYIHPEVCRGTETKGPFPKTVLPTFQLSVWPRTRRESLRLKSSPQPRGIACAPWLECLFSGESLICPARCLGVASSGGNAQTEVREALGELGGAPFTFLHAGARDGGGWSGFPWLEMPSWRLFAYPTRHLTEMSCDDADLSGHLVGLSQTAVSSWTGVTSTQGTLFRLAWCQQAKSPRILKPNQKPPCASPIMYPNLSQPKGDHR